MRNKIVPVLILTVIGFTTNLTFAAGGRIEGPNVIAPDRYVYYPGTEVLAEDEVRVIACGTGMPDQRRGQASACFLFEFGNGEKLIFDLGSGSMRKTGCSMSIRRNTSWRIRIGALKSPGTNQPNNFRGDRDSTKGGSSYFLVSSSIRSFCRRASLRSGSSPNMLISQAW